jgi:aminoglycoside phosphotransferase
LRELTAGCHWQRVTVGASGAEVFRSTRTGATPWYLKVTTRAAGVDTTAEAQRLEWLRDRLPVPRGVAFADEPAASYLLMTAVSGLDATDPAHLAEPERLVYLLAQGLRHVHALPTEDCPFDHRLDAEIARAEARMHHGQVDEADFDQQRQGQRAADLFQTLLVTQPRAEDLVFTHGDYCLPNIMIDAGQVSGFLDLGRAGVGDRYRDLSLAARSITRNLGAHWQRLFFQAYGLDTPDPAKVEFCQLLDEFS